MPVETAWEDEATQDSSPDPGSPAEETQDEASVEDETRTIPRIESAIPAEDDPTSKLAVQDEMPHSGRLILASIFAIALVSGLALYLTHPWNPDPHSIKATEEADTSTAGFPGTVETLTGQDSSSSPIIEDVSGDDATFVQLSQAYDRLGRYAKRADDNESLFDEETSDVEVLHQHKHEADLLAIDVRNLIASLEHIDVSSGAYAEDRDNLLELAQWLDSRVTSIVGAWEALMEQERVDQSEVDPEDEDYVDPAEQSAKLRNEAATYRQQFEDHYEKRQPHQQEPKQDEQDKEE